MFLRIFYATVPANAFIIFVRQIGQIRQMDVMPLDVPRDDRRKDWRSLPRGPRLRIRAPSEAAQQVTELLRRTMRDLPERVSPSDCYYLAATLKLISDLRQDEVLGDQMVAGFERQLIELRERIDALELFK
jgi:hypothetical protein